LVIPPPNVTGKLHLGHVMDTIPDDIVARYKRMKGYDVLWVPGMDHAGIATQAKVEEKLRKEGISRYDLAAKPSSKKPGSGRTNTPRPSMSNGRSSAYRSITPGSVSPWTKAFRMPSNTSSSPSITKG
jgi:hypothetical protein